jgi:hypothetical protein
MATWAAAPDAPSQPRTGASLECLFLTWQTRRVTFQSPRPWRGVPNRLSPL